MKKIIISAIIIVCANFANGQSNYLSRFAYANKDTLRTQVRMAAIDVAVDRVDTATNANRRLCNDVLGEPTASPWVDMFIYQIVVTLATPTPTDGQVRTSILALWSRVAALNTRR